MTVPVPDQLEYISDANGVTKDFPYPKRFLQKDEVVVLLRNADGVDTPQILNTHYTIAGSSWPSGGTITFNVAPASGLKVVRYRMTQAKQTVGLANNQRNDAPSVELQLDRMVMAVQDRDQLLNSTAGGLVAEIAARKEGDSLLNSRVDNEIIDRENGDKAVASLIGQAGDIEIPMYDTRLAVTFARIKPTVNSIRTGGYAAPGDGGAALYKRVASEPSHAGKVMSADGAWWELAETEPNVKMFGAVGDGITDDQAAITAAVEFAYGKGLRMYWPDREYLSTATIPNFHGVNHSGPGVVKRGSEVFYVDPSMRNNETLTYKVPTSFPDLQTAFNYLGRYTLGTGTSITLIIEGGHALTKGLKLVGGDYSHITISGEDPEVYITESFQWVATEAPPGTARVVCVFHRCIAPTIDITLNLTGNEDATGYSVTGCSSIAFTPNAGALGASTAGIILSSGSQAYADFTLWMGAGGNGVWVTTGSKGSFQSANASNSSTGFFFARGSSGTLATTIARNCSVRGIRSSSTSGVMAQGADVSGSAIGLQATAAGSLEAAGAIADNCTTNGIEASEMARINAPLASAKNAVNAGVIAYNGGYIQFENSDASGGGVRDIHVVRGSIINATGSTGTPSIAVNTTTANGIIFKGA